MEMGDKNRTVEAREINYRLPIPGSFGGNEKAAVIARRRRNRLDRPLGTQIGHRSVQGNPPYRRRGIAQKGNGNTGERRNSTKGDLVATTQDLNYPRIGLPKTPRSPSDSLDNPQWRTKDMTPIFENPASSLSKQRPEQGNQSARVYYRIYPCNVQYLKTNLFG